MTDEKKEETAEATTEPTTTEKPTEAASDDPMTKRLKELGVSSEMIQKIKEELGAETVEDLEKYLTEDQLIKIGMKPIQVSKLMNALQGTKPREVSPEVDPNAELDEDETPTKAHIGSFANALGADVGTLMLLMSGGLGADVDLSGIMPIASLVAGYNPKRRDMYLMVMGQVERRLGVPIIVINPDGSINRELTTQYIEGLEEGFDPAENNIYFDAESQPHEVIRVGVDAQSIYDADPLVPTKALQKNGMGTGRINWTNVSLEVRQVTYFASTNTHEIDPVNDGHLSWLRDHIKPEANRLIFHGQAPRAISAFNDAARTGSLPTLRVMLTRSPRAAEIMPRRRRTTARDLTGIGGPKNGDEL